MKATVKVHKFWDPFMKYSCLAGLLIIIAEINIYRSTIISVYIPIAVIAGLTFFLQTVTYSKFKKIYPEAKYHQLLIYHLFSGGFIGCYLFMATNYYFLDSDLKYYSFQIKEKASMPGDKRHRNERPQIVRFDFQGSEKDLIFDYSDKYKVEQANKVVVSTRRGLLGFEVICSRNLM